MWAATPSRCAIRSLLLRLALVVPCACFLAYNDGLFDWWSLYTIEL